MLEDLKEAREEKLRELKKQKVDPYPAKSERTHTVGAVQETFTELEKTQARVAMTGRLRSLRSHGALTFADLEDESGRFQLFFHRDQLGVEKYDFLKFLDIGDFVEVQGKVFVTQKGQQTLAVENCKLLTKSLLPLPEKWHGLSDEETRYRKRHLDLLMNQNVKNLFRQRTLFVSHIRTFLNEQGFMEVETPILESVPGGAEAEPFITHHHKLDTDFYLRISLELHLKRLLVGGFEKIYEIGRVFRNEGLSTQHLQEFTLLEFYWAYAEYEDLMKFVEQFYMNIIQKTFGTLQIPYRGEILNFTAPWPRFDYHELLKVKGGLDLNEMTDVEDLRRWAKEKDIKVDPYAGRGRIIDQIYKKVVRPALVQPCFLMNHPLDVSPLAKKMTGDSERVERMQVLIAGAEVGNGFSELNDPLDQRERFMKQEALRQAGDKEAQMIDEDFLEALELGMPPTAGFGVGIDRLFMILTDQPSIRDTVFFPMMRPKTLGDPKEESKYKS